jgi:S1/P1 Nuclease
MRRQRNIEHGQYPFLSLGDWMANKWMQTNQLLNSSTSYRQGQVALKFLIHFIGDIHQPLHTENESKGGNGIPVLFGNKTTNLHSVWDTEIPVKMQGLEESTLAYDVDEKAHAKAWADRLFLLGMGIDPTSCLDIRKPQDCALDWAGEVNKYICSYVLKDDVAGVLGIDLSGDYFAGAAPIVEAMVAKAGWRLGMWMNGLAAARNASGISLQYGQSQDVLSQEL